jgi:hypothetical protein
LHFEPDTAKQDINRRAAVKGVPLCPSGIEERDEYPYAASKEGGTNTGKRAQVMCVPVSEQNTQSADTRSFYKNELQRRDVAPFYVLPVPY